MNFLQTRVRKHPFSTEHAARSAAPVQRWAATAAVACWAAFAATAPASAQRHITSAATPYVDLDATACGCGNADGCASCSTGCPTACGRDWYWIAGGELTFLTPRFSQNVAASTIQSDGVRFESFTDTDFNYDLEFAPRVFLGLQNENGVGVRGQYWQFNNDPDSVTLSPPANGFGRIFSPPFGDVDISTTIPSDVFTASSTLNVYAIDLEAVNRTDFCSWWLEMSAGLRYASVEQSYLAQQRNAAGRLGGEIDYSHSLQGIGPTVSFRAVRPISTCLTLFGQLRGSLVFGEGSSSLTAVEDADLQTPFVTTATTSRDDLLPIGEVRCGVGWQGADYCGWQPFAQVALEGQLWQGAGNASSETGDLGFFGFGAAFGITH